MKRARECWIAVALFAVSGQACTAQTGPVSKKAPAVIQYEIRGLVVNALDGSPVPRSHLSASLAGHGGGFNRRQFPASENIFYADAEGRFSIVLPSAGAWRLTAGARGFVTQAYQEHFNFSSAVVLTEKAPTTDLRFELKPEASVAGVIVDEAGEAVRGSQVSLENVPPVLPGVPQPPSTTRGTTQTDDRGMYEFDNLGPGSYRVRVQTKPWYAAYAQTGNNADTLDPSLDVAYPTVWFPGVEDSGLAETISLRAGDVRQADFHLAPVASIHLKLVPPPLASTENNSPQIPMFPVVEQVASGGGGRSLIATSIRNDAQGQFDVGGLTPGLYQIRWMGPNQGSHTTLVDVKANSSRTVDTNAAASDVAKLDLRFDVMNDMGEESGLRRGDPTVVLIDEDSRSRSFSSNASLGRSGLADGRPEGRSRVMDVTPGRYEVVLQGRQDLFLTGITATGAKVAGREVTVQAGESTLTLHVAGGLANLDGFVTMRDKPVVGALVMLVPVTIDDPGSIPVLRRDQTNTDGSFDIANVIPGQYILLAIDHGWEINWADASTLRRYLMQGVPIELRPSATVKQSVQATAP